MTRKRILLGSLIVFCFLGVLFPVTEPAADETRAIRVVQEKEYVSDLGNKIVVAAPEKTLSPLAAGGIGLQAMLSKSLGFAFDIQAAYIFRKTAQILVAPSLALVLKF